MVHRRCGFDLDPDEISRYRFELSDLWRPVLYVMGIGTWFMVMGGLLYTYRSLQRPVIEAEDVETIEAEDGRGASSPR